MSHAKVNKQHLRLIVQLFYDRATKPNCYKTSSSHRYTSLIKSLHNQSSALHFNEKKNSFKIAQFAWHRALNKTKRASTQSMPQQRKQKVQP